MVTNNRHLFTFNLGGRTTYSADIRSQELVARVRWFINMRWLAVLAGCGGIVAAAGQLLPAKLNPYYFLGVTIFLAVANLIYSFTTRRLTEKEPCYRGVKILLVVQMMGDFIALSLLTYACGSIETPILTLFLAHIILATLFFNRMTSLSIIVAAWAFASLPLFMEWAGVLPTLSIFNGTFKQMVTGNFLITGGFLAGIGGTFFVCWYLVSEITSSLRLREGQLEEAYHMLVQMDREKTQAAIRATHELKAPFAAIKSYVYTLRDGYCGQLTDEAQKVVARIGVRCDQLTQKITDIIHLSNLRTLLVTNVNLVPVELVSLLSQEVKDAELLGGPRKITFQNHAQSAKPVYILGSRPHLKTLFSNLIRNATQYSHDGGGVELSIYREPGRVSVSVKDHGIGIPKKNLDKIFEEHFRSNNAVAHYPNGTGLGLPMVKEIVMLHGGVIKVLSEEGKGSEFTVSFDTTELKDIGGSDGKNSDH